MLERARRLGPHTTVVVDLRYVVPGLEVVITRRFEGPRPYLATAYRNNDRLVVGNAAPSRLSALISVLPFVETRGWD